MHVVDVVVAVVMLQGRQSWQLSRDGYEQRIDRLEERVIRILHDKLRWVSHSPTPSSPEPHHCTPP